MRAHLSQRRLRRDVRSVHRSVHDPAPILAMFAAAQPCEMVANRDENAPLSEQGTYVEIRIPRMDRNAEEVDQLVGPRRSGLPDRVDRVWRDAGSDSHRLPAGSTGALQPCVARG